MIRPAIIAALMACPVLADTGSDRFAASCGTKPLRFDPQNPFGDRHSQAWIAYSEWQAYCDGERLRFVFGGDEPTHVPLPAGVWLLGGALVGLELARKRK